MLAQRAAAEGLAWENGTSQRASGWVGEKVARSKGRATQPSLGPLLRFEIQGIALAGLDARPAV